MNSLVGADLKRIIAKYSMYVVVGVLVLVIFFKKPADTASDQIEFYHLLFDSLGLVFICIPIYLSVYADEVKSGIMISIVGMGMGRKKIVCAKLLDSLFLLIGSYMILCIAAIIKNSISGFVVTPRQTGFLIIFCIICVIRGIGLIALTSLVLFLTMSANVGILVLVLAGVVAGSLLQTIQERTKLPFYDISYIGQLEHAYAAMQAGNMSFALIGALFYLAIVIIVNIIIFSKKEMDL